MKYETGKWPGGSGGIFGGAAGQCDGGVYPRGAGAVGSCGRWYCLRPGQETLHRGAAPMQTDKAPNGEKIILDLCGGSGAWSRPYLMAGYDVRVITLPDYDVMTYRPPNGVYGILAAPPCTEFSLAKNGSRRSRDLAAGMITVEACLKIIWQCQQHSKLAFWALENPVGLLRRFLGRPPYTFYQWWFGDLGIKRTDLWGMFSPPRQRVFERPANPYFIKRYKSGKTNQFACASPNCPDWAEEYISSQPDKRAALRAITPEGFAQAFFMVNR